MPPLRVAMAINYLHPFPWHRYAYNGCTDRVRKISVSRGREGERGGEGRANTLITRQASLLAQITNEIFAHRKKSPFVISSAARKSSKAFRR